MSSEGTITGLNGEFVVGTDRVARITAWAINPTLASTNEWGDSDSGGHTNRSHGRLDCTFTAEGKFETTDEVWNLFERGDTVIAVLWLNAALYYDFPRALCTDFNLTVDSDTEEVVGWTSAWGEDGISYRPGDPAATPRVLPA